ncbi:hypothetical protein GCM10009765_27630 [Fodinicola feengrottensis]|uniref:Uncharacterized protein n=1 Tax=Fodinicola feengrottensis TaxID=435914 RepID=A0ABN2GVE5_9ACTN
MAVVLAGAPARRVPVRPPRRATAASHRAATDPCSPPGAADAVPISAIGGSGIDAAGRPATGSARIGATTVHAR